MKKTQEYSSCNNCGSSDTSIFLKNLTSWEHVGVFTLVKCSNCSLVYVNPRPIQSVIGAYYPPASYWGDDVTISNKSLSLEKLRETSYGYLYQKILRVKKKGRVLDIGAGTGMFLSKFKDLGFQVEGVEYSKEASVYAQKTFGAKLKTGDFLDQKFEKNTYTVVTLNNSLEHLYDPLKTLQELYEVMKKGGIIVITVPNIESLGYTLFRQNWYALQPPRHLYHFSEKTLYEMLSKSGFASMQAHYGYFQHNYYTLLESIRLSKSEKFKKGERGGVILKTSKQKFSIKKELLKMLAKGAAYGLAHLGSSMHKSEVITIVAQKR